MNFEGYLPYAIEDILRANMATLKAKTAVREIMIKHVRLVNNVIEDVKINLREKKWMELLREVFANRCESLD
jgi:hypothetical protein